LTTAYLSLGSNLGDREGYLRKALSLLAGDDLVIARVSSVYGTEPMELRAQSWFLNIVAEIRTSLDPLGLLRRCQQAEADLGRKRTIPKGPRTVDIDILLYGDRVIEKPDIVVPHPAMAERRFVLEPLAEIAPNLTIPKSGKKVSDLLAGVHSQVVRKLGAIEGL